MQQALGIQAEEEEGKKQHQAEGSEAGKQAQGWPWGALAFEQAF